jgi:hypothetical protein
LGDTVDTPFKILEKTELGERIQATLDELPSSLSDLVPEIYLMGAA